MLLCKTYIVGPFVAQEMTANSSDVLKQQPSVVIKQESGTHSELLQNTMSMTPGNSSLQPSLPSHDDKSTISGWQCMSSFVMCCICCACYGKQSYKYSKTFH